MEHSVALNTERPTGSRAAAGGSRLIRYRAQPLSAAPLPFVEYGDYPLVSPAHRSEVSIVREPVVSSAFTWPQRHHRRHSRPTGAPTVSVEDHVSASSLRRKLRSHPLGRKNRGAAQAGRSGPSNRATRYLVVRLRAEHLELDHWRPAPPTFHSIPQCPLARGLPAQPERAQQRYLRTAIRSFTANGSRPQVGDRRSPVGVRRE